ncbi:DNA repair protein RadC (fragment) [Bacillus sp. 349Y]
MTRRPVECGRLLGIEVLDHLIVNAKADFYSMKENGHL